MVGGGKSMGPSKLSHGTWGFQKRVYGTHSRVAAMIPGPCCLSLDENCELF